MKKAYIFDLDGTLTDTLESLTYSTNKALEVMGLPEITREQCRLFIGGGARVLLEKAVACSKDDFDSAYMDEVVKVFLEIFTEYCSYKVVPYEGVIELLEALKAEGIKMAVLTNKPHKMAVKVVEDVFGSEYFDYVQGQGEQFPRKPDSKCVEHVLGELGVTKEESVYIGDSEVDIQTGHNAQVTTVAVDWGFRDRVDLERENPKWIVSEVSDLLQFK